MIQSLIHKLEVGGGHRYVRIALGLIALAALAVWYDLAAFKNFSTREAMDAAQLARNIATGRGYTTLFIRPFSLHLVHRAATNKLAYLAQPKPGPPGRQPNAEQTRLSNLIHLREPHPDLANPPVYPLLLAGVLKVMPFDYSVLTAKSFSVYKPDLWIGIFNQALFLGAVVLVFRLARRLFDEPVAWVSAAAVAGAELFWRFSISGLSTILLVLIFLGLVSVLARIDRAARAGITDQVVGPNAPAAPTPSGPVAAQAGHGKRGLIVLSVLAGVLVGIGGLTRYAFGWLIIPVAVFLGMLPGGRRGLLSVWALLAFLVVMAPWVARNWNISGRPFGTAGFAICQNTSQFSGDQLERTLNPDFSRLSPMDLLRKLVRSVREMLLNELPKFGGSWVSAFSLVGLLLRFRNRTLARLRWFLLLCLAEFTVVQALGRTGLTADSPEINSENLLVILAPVVFMYGGSLVFVLLDQFALPSRAARLAVIGLFCLIISAPLIGQLLAPLPAAVAYPPYYPPWIQLKTQWLEEKELLMTDIPWAVAWYGQRQSIWLSVKYKNQLSDKRRNDFFHLNDYYKPVKALYLSARTMKSVESRALWQWGYFRELDTAQGRKGDQTGSVWQWNRAESPEDWDNFILRALVMRQLPATFPLKAVPWGIVPEFFLTESGRVAGKPFPLPEH